MLRESIYIRESYLEVLRKLDALGNDFALVLSGSPGIGKSAFAVLLLHHLAKQRAKVAYRYIHEELGDTIVYFDFSKLPKINVEVASQWNALWEHLLDRSVDPDVWRIRDGAAAPTQYGGRGRVVILCSPNVENYRRFAKGKGCKVWWLPVWSHSELEECRRRLYPEVDKDVMEKRILEFGGLIRFVLANPDSSFEDVAFTLSAEQAIALYHLSLASVESDLRHIFAHIAVSADLRRVGYFLGSPAIKRLVFRKAQDGRWKDLVDLVQASAKREVGKMGGESLEEFAHVSLLEGLELDREDIRQTFRRGRGRPKQTGESEPTQEQDQTSEEIRNLLRGRKRIRWDAPENTDPIPTSPDEYLQPSTDNNDRGTL